VDHKERSFLDLTKHSLHSILIQMGVFLFAITVRNPEEPEPKQDVERLGKLVFGYAALPNLRFE
jgi:hypothetical protein